MKRPGQRGQILPQRWIRLAGPALILLGVFLILLWVGLKVGRAYDAARQAIAHLGALQEWSSRPPQELLDNFEELKGHIEAAGRDLATVRAEIGFLDPLLHGLSWVPSYGDELAATPYLTAIAAELSGAASDLAQVASQLLPIFREGGEDGLLRTLAVLQENRPLLQQARARLQHAVYLRTLFDPTSLRDGPYGRFLPLLEELDPLLPTAVRALGLLDDFLPQAREVLGGAGPRRYLLLGQNNFELRATGGFLGSMGVMTVEGGEIADLDYRRSYDWDNPNREKMQPPYPYVRYMRFGAWFIRDANWYADFPTSARMVEEFWQRDGHGTVDGVIAVDLYAVQNLLEALGPVEVPGYGVSIGGSNALETLWEGYRRDPGFLPALTSAVAGRLQDPDLLQPERLPALLVALGRSLEEKHILLYFNDPTLQAAVVRAGWGGALRSDPGDFLMVVDSDFSYAEVNRFIEQEIAYRVSLDHGLQVRESTVTLTYRNHFDRWSSAETREQFGGACFDPQTEDLEVFPGCYGDYIRLYLPRGSRFVRAEGFDDGMEYREESGRTCIAGYLRVLPGEERTVSVTYVPPAGPLGGQYRLTLQKQPGTGALPVRVEVEVVGSEPAEASLQTDLRTDRVITAVWQEGKLVLSGEGSATQVDPGKQAARQAFGEGLALWEAGRREEALARWRTASTADLILDRANLLLHRGRPDEAEALCQAALEVAPPSARAYFLLGKVFQERKDTEEARQAWEKAVALQPENPAARLELGLLFEAGGDVEQAYAHLQYADRKEASFILWQRVWEHLNAGEKEAGIKVLELLIRLTPEDLNARFVLADQLRVLKEYDRSLAAYEEAHRLAPTDVRFYTGRGQLYADQGRGEEALADLEEAVQVAPRSAEAWFYLGLYRWRFRNDAPGALDALRKAVDLNPNAWYATELGHVYLASGNPGAAIAAYERAVTLPGRNAYAWYSLGRAYQQQERWEEAASAYAEAVSLEPRNAWLHAALAHAYEQAGKKEKALAEYQAALALEPDHAEWQEAVERLGGER
ncbi:MAG: tetratricopeptide repeat protein [Chloroflexia bacterium]